jgi:hypothetical protein
MLRGSQKNCEVEIHGRPQQKRVLSQIDPYESQISVRIIRDTIDFGKKVFNLLIGSNFS